jgi:hypothetical protein
MTGEVREVQPALAARTRRRTNQRQVHIVRRIFGFTAQGKHAAADSATNERPQFRRERLSDGDDLIEF